MKKIITVSIFTVALAAVITGCLKDKGYDSNQYGINLNGSPKGVSFPEGVNDANVKAIDFSTNYREIKPILGRPGLRHPPAVRH